MDCDFVDCPLDFKCCSRCWRVVKSKNPASVCHAPCRGKPHWWEFGYWLEAFLRRRLRITKAGWKAFRGTKRICGGMHCWWETLPEEHHRCGCTQREDALNKAGRTLARLLRLTRPRHK